MKTNLVGWFEIPVSSMERAVKFYETVFGLNVHVEQFGPMLMGWFPHDDKKFGAGGALVYNEEFYKPSTEGSLVYFNSEDVSIEVSRIEDAGGKVLQEKTLISEEIGYMALFIDSEGNRIALHSNN
ncbi:VOC family protein [Urechidicola vernalis]|uniref:VOC family protein n=1 Tax=Urechidicola vernalis TaxID=3075600 RepID=A0ABU2Y2R8_9FLAO|nr:VOC family protein [Urechidicola sp. P050]MDT0552327.1 VOC family protein [Urechidicola sp. P050]